MNKIEQQLKVFNKIVEQIDVLVEILKMDQNNFESREETINTNFSKLITLIKEDLTRRDTIADLRSSGSNESLLMMTLLRNKKKYAEKIIVAKGPTLDEFWEMLNNHDWYYAFSDNHGVYLRGKARLELLKNLASISFEHQEMFDAFSLHFATNISDNPTPKPLRPKKKINNIIINGHKIEAHTNLEIVNLPFANLYRANLSYADLFYADLSYADLSYADLSDAKLSYADLSYADLSDAKLSHANLYRADLRYANLSYAKLSHADLSDANLFYVKLSHADLSGVDLSGAKLSYANLSEANLSEAKLSHADLSGANLSGAKLSYANLYRAIGIVSLNMSNRTLYANMRQNEQGEWYAHVYNGCWRDYEGGTIDQLEEAVIEKYGNDSHYHQMEIPYLRSWEKLEIKRLQGE